MFALHGLPKASCASSSFLIPNPNPNRNRPVLVGVMVAYIAGHPLFLKTGRDDDDDDVVVVAEPARLG